MAEPRASADLDGSLHRCLGMVGLLIGGRFALLFGVFVLSGTAHLLLSRFACDTKLERLQGFWIADVHRAWRTPLEK